jgi:uncharacterized protein YndB with AHSA1/START domain
MSHAATVARVVPAPPDRVWLAVASPQLEGRFWPASFAAQATIEARVGGVVTLRSERMGMGFSGVYRSMEERRRLEHTWRWDGETLETVVRIQLAPSGTGTEIVVRHEGFPDASTAEEHAQGWSDCLDRLPAYLATAEG